MLTPGRLPALRASPYGCCFARVCTCMSLSLQVKITDAALCFPLRPPQFNPRRRCVNLCAARSEGVEMIYHCHINICLRSHIKLVDLLNKEEADSPGESRRFPLSHSLYLVKCKNNSDYIRIKAAIVVKFAILEILKKKH